MKKNELKEIKDLYLNDTSLDNQINIDIKLLIETVDNLMSIVNKYEKIRKL